MRESGIAFFTGVISGGECVGGAVKNDLVFGVGQETARRTVELVRRTIANVGIGDVGIGAGRAAACGIRRRRSRRGLRWLFYCGRGFGDLRGFGGSGSLRNGRLRRDRLRISGHGTP